MKTSSAAPFDGAAYFDGLNMFGIRLGLDATGELLHRAGDPHRELRFLHLAGTNGKGSTGAILECALRSAGLRTGFYTSPHLIDIRERFRIDGKAVATDVFNDAVRRLAEAAAGGSFSYFEFATVLGAMLFHEAKADVVVWETGMGGRLDATNAVETSASIITNIALDHQASLGNTIPEIAGEKAGIIKPGVPVFHGYLTPDAEAVITAKAKELGSPVIPPPFPVPAGRYADCDGVPMQTFFHGGREITLPLLGAMQRRNFLLAANVLEYFAPRLGFDADRAFSGLKHVRWPGRFQQVEPGLFIDGGHNPDGITALHEALKEAFPGEKFTVIYGAFRDKHVENCVPLLAQLAKEFRFVPLREEGREHCSFEDLAALAAPAGVPCRREQSGAGAVEHALAECSGKVIVSGSLNLAGEILEARGEMQKVLDLI